MTSPSRRPWRPIAFVILATGILASAGCYVDFIEGDWRAENPDLRMHLDLEQTQNVVSGTGWVAGTNDSAAVTVSGVFHDPGVYLVITAPGMETLYIEGELSGDRIRGVADGSGYENMSVWLRR